MTICFAYTEGDYLNITAEQWRSDPASRRALFQQRYAAGLTAGILTFYGGAKMGLSALPVLALIALFSVAAFYLCKAAQSYKMKRKVHRAWREAEGRQAVSGYTVTLEAKGLRIDDEYHELLYKWNRIRAVETTETQVIVKQIHGDRLFLPRRAFADAAHERAFIIEIERHIAAVETAGAVVPSASGAWYRSRSEVDTNETNVNRVSGS